VLAQAREIPSHSPPGRDNGARAARDAAPGVRPPSTTLGNPPRTSCAMEPRLSCGALGSGLGFVGSPVGNNTGDFILGPVLGRPRRLERRFKLQPQLPGQTVPTAVRYSATIADVLVLGPPDRISPRAVKCGWSAMRRERPSMHSMRCGLATPMSSLPAGSGRPMVTLPPTA